MTAAEENSFFGRLTHLCWWKANGTVIDALLLCERLSDDDKMKTGMSYVHAFKEFPRQAA